MVSDVVVVGAGPSGLTVANLLGLDGLDVVVVERERQLYTFPRAVGIDDESLRTCQTIGLVDAVLADAIENTPIRYHTSWGRCLAHVKPSAKPYGWSRRNNFLQPMFESTLRAGVERFPGVSLLEGHELVGFTEDAEGVRAVVRTDEGRDLTVRCRYLVGADGGRSTVRKLAGIELVGETAPARWLVVDVCDDELDAPYSAVYCDPDSPVLMVPLPYRHRRFEFLLGDNDDEAAVTSEDHVLSLLAPRYGDTPLPTVVRARVYLHHSRVAETFQRGRVFLVGDAAHLQPPFFGQGMNSGLRDSTNLAWKLSAVVSGRASEAILDTYDSERRPHATTMVQFATRIGGMYRPRNRFTERLRDLAFRALQVVPGGRDYVLQMRYKPMPWYQDGVVVTEGGEGVVGRMFPQPEVETLDGARMLLDDTLGANFAIIGIGFDPIRFLDASTVDGLARAGARFVYVAPPRTGEVPAGGERVTVLFDVDGAFRDWRLANPGHEGIMLRPDRYVAAVADRADLDRAATALLAVLQPPGITDRHGGRDEWTPSR